MKSKLRRVKYAIKYWWQRRTRGFGDDDLWNLDHTIAEFVLPRLTAYRNSFGGMPACYSADEWRSKLDEMIWSFEYITREWDDELVMQSVEEVDQETERCRQGLEAFGYWFRALWD